MIKEVGDDDKRSFESTEEECKARTRKQIKVCCTVISGKKGEHAVTLKVANVNLDPHIKYEDPGLPSMTRDDLLAASAPSLSKSKVVSVNPEPMHKVFAAF